MKKKLTGSIIAAFFICSVLISAMTVFAQSDGLQGTSSLTASIAAASEKKHYLEEAVSKLVEEGKLTKEKAEKILKYKEKWLKEQCKQDKMSKDQLKKQRKKGSLLRDLIHDGIISQAEGEAIKAKLKEMKEERLHGGLQQLVDRGVLSGEDIDNIRSYMLKLRSERKEQLEKLNSMTPEEREKYYEGAKKDRKDIITRMVEDGIITEKQAEEIRKAVPELDGKKYRKDR